MFGFCGRNNGTPPAIISIGRLIEKKGFHDLIEACRVLCERGVEFRCEIIGEGPLESSLREQITATGLTTLVTLTGPLPQGEVMKRLACSALFVLPCVAEVGGGMDNLPTVVMEAMAAGDFDSAWWRSGNGAGRVHRSAGAGTSAGRFGRRTRAGPCRSTTRAIARRSGPAAGGGVVCDRQKCRSAARSLPTSRCLTPIA